MHGRTNGTVRETSSSLHIGPVTAYDIYSDRGCHAQTLRRALPKQRLLLLRRSLQASGECVFFE